MTLGEKLSKLRKENNYTQEQLADILNVSRQSISKWESGIAYPETEKLIKLGKLYNCSMDYLLNDDVTEKQYEKHQDASFKFKLYFKERKSQKQIFGMPLYHIGKNARGFFAVGLRAKGVISLGFLSCGIFSFGLLSFGVLSFGLIALGLVCAGVLSAGLIAAGAIALGIFAVGAISVGIVSIGALSVGCFSCGALAIGKYIAVGDHARAIIAIAKTEARGSVYQLLAVTLSPEQRADVLKLLSENVPSWLSWAAELFKLFI